MESIWVMAGFVERVENITNAYNILPKNQKYDTTRVI